MLQQVAQNCTWYTSLKPPLPSSLWIRYLWLSNVPHWYVPICSSFISLKDLYKCADGSQRGKYLLSHGCLLLFVGAEAFGHFNILLVYTSLPKPARLSYTRLWVQSYSLVGIAFALLGLNKMRKASHQGLSLNLQEKQMANWSLAWGIFVFHVPNALPLYAECLPPASSLKALPAKLRSRWGWLLDCILQEAFGIIVSQALTDNKEASLLHGWSVQATFRISSWAT